MVKKLGMMNKNIFLIFFEVESAITIGVKYRNNEEIQLILKPTEKNKFVDNAPIRLLIPTDKRMRRVFSSSDKISTLFKFLGFSTNEIISICREIHEDMGSKKLIVPYL